MDIVLKYFADFTEVQLRQMRALEGAYAEWNEKINVVSRKDIEALYEKHVLHSLAIAALVNFHAGAEVVDIGTGGGFPGVPLAIFFPEVHFTLVDGIAKKIKVVQEVCAAAGISNVTAVQGRVEEMKDKNYDFAVSRAVAPLGDLWKWIKPSLKPGQMADELPNGLLCLKGGNLRQEIAESGLQKRAQAWNVHDIFPEPFFEEKFIIYVPR